MAAGTKMLSELGLTPLNGPDRPVSGLSVDSRQVKPGHLFAALPGSNMHGAEFVPYALRMGAGAILTDRAGEGVGARRICGHPMSPLS